MTHSDSDGKTYCSFVVRALLDSREKAVKLRLDGGRDMWVPRSQIDDLSALERATPDDMADGKVVIRIVAWFCRKEGL